MSYISSEDRNGQPPVVVINDAFKREVFGDTSAIGCEAQVLTFLDS
jgi:hypothetical protein